MNKTAEFKATQAAVSWHHSMLRWALSRCESVPHELINIIREASNDRVLKYGKGRMEKE